MGRCWRGRGCQVGSSRFLRHNLSGWSGRGPAASEVYTRASKCPEWAIRVVMSVGIFIGRESRNPIHMGRRTPVMVVWRLAVDTFMMRV